MSDPVVDPTIPVTTETAAEPEPVFRRRIAADGTETIHQVAPDGTETVQPPSPAAPLPEVVHLRTQVTSVFAILDEENNAVNPTPLTIELDKLNAATLTAVLARVREEKQKFAEQARAAGLA